jgi:hypothetical protein
MNEIKGKLTESIEREISQQEIANRIMGLNYKRK